MTRVLVLALLALVFHALLAGLAVAFGSSSLPLMPAVLLVSYAALVEPPVVAALAASTVGIVLDALAGAPLGLNMLACLLALLLGRFAASWVKSPRGLSAFLYAAALSAGYHLFVVTLLYVFGSHPEGLALHGLVGAALWNGFAALLVFPFTQWLLVRLGLEEREETLSERLARRR